MKALTSPIAILDGNALPLDAESAESEQAAPGEGFVAVLALVNAQTTKGPQPVKVLAPSVGVQSAPAETKKGVELKGTEVVKGALPTLLVKREDVAPTQAFLPWPGVEFPAVASAAKPDLPVVQEIPDSVSESKLAVSSPGPVVSAKPADMVVGLPQLAVSSPGPVVSAKPADMVVGPPQLAAADEQTPLPADARVALKAEAKDATKGIVSRKLIARAVDDLKNAQDAALPSPVGQGAQSLLAPVPAQAAPTAPVAVAPSATSKTTETTRLAAAGPSTSDVAMRDAPSELQVAPAGFSDLLTTPVDAPVPTASAAVQAPIPMSNKETGAVVTKIEFYESSPSSEAKEAGPIEANAEPLPRADDETLSDDAESLPSDASEDSASSEREPGREPVAVAPQPRFEVTEGKGMRGLDAVVASLLRPYQEKSESKSGPRVATASAPHISVDTGKSQTVKGEERVANVAQALDSAALKRDEEDRRGELRELLEPSAPHFIQHAEVPREASAPEQAAPATPSPVNVPAPLPDPDAAMMGKLARGESLNAAVSIEHPELGTMDLLVQNENGRIDVRATLDTPRAAAVLRAHESALRYGVQQAGLTFGALRVNARTGETKVERPRDALKRRRERDWEA